MNKLFIDTSAFYSKGHNFSEENTIIRLLIKNKNEQKYEYCNLSVIDNEIIDDLKEKVSEEESKVKKIKWIKNYIDDSNIINECNRFLEEYNDFKKNINAIDHDVSKINPEKIFQKYFENQLPFEIKTTKKSEFPDAFISEYLNNLTVISGEKIYFVSEDKGLNKSLNANIEIYDDLEKFLSNINGVDSITYHKLLNFICNNLAAIAKKLINKINFEYYDLEDEVFEVEDIKIQRILNIDVVENENGKYYINCETDFLILEGDFSCLDYNNSYMPNDCDFYAVREYMRTNELPIVNFEFLLVLTDIGSDQYDIEIANELTVSVNYELFEKSGCRSYSCDENSWDQDGGPYR